MPKSKREKLVHLTKTSKKGKVQKEKLVAQLQDAVDSFKFAFVFVPENMRNDKLKEVRQEWQGSRFFLGKNKVMAHALGRTPSSEYAENLHKLTDKITGNCGLLFTNSSKEQVEKFFSDFEESQFARSGFVATSEFSIPAGPLPQTEFPFSIEPQLRKLGLPTKLNNGVVELLSNVTVCKEGDELTPEQCKILQLWGVQMAVFKISLKAVWARGGAFMDLETGETTEGSGDVDLRETKQQSKQASSKGSGSGRAERAKAAKTGGGAKEEKKSAKKAAAASAMDDPWDDNEGVIHLDESMDAAMVFGVDGTDEELAKKGLSRSAAKPKKQSGKGKGKAAAGAGGAGGAGAGAGGFSFGGAIDFSGLNPDKNPDLLAGNADVEDISMTAAKPLPKKPKVKATAAAVPVAKKRVPKKTFAAGGAESKGAGAGAAAESKDVDMDTGADGGELKFAPSKSSGKGSRAVLAQKAKVKAKAKAVAKKKAASAKGKGKAGGAGAAGSHKGAAAMSLEDD